MFYSEFWESIMKSTCILYSIFGKLTPFMFFSFNLRGHLWISQKQEESVIRQRYLHFWASFTAAQGTTGPFGLTVAIFMTQYTLSVAIY